MTRAVGYGRTSSLTNVGEGKHSLQRQKEAIKSYAAQANYKLVGGYFDEGVSGAIHVMDRPAFKNMIDAMVGNGIKVILVESADRFARDLIVQIVGYDKLTEMGITIIPANAPSYFREETPTGVFIRNVLGAVAEFDKSQLVKRLREAREAKTARGERGVGRKSLAEKIPVGVVRDIMRLYKVKVAYATIAKTITMNTDTTLTKDQVRKVILWVNENGMPDGRNAAMTSPIGYDQIK